MTLPRTLPDREFAKFVEDKNSKTAVRVTDSNTTVKDGANYYNRVIVTEESLYETLENQTKTITTSATKIPTPTYAKSFLIQNLTPETTVYVGGSDVSTSDLALEYGDVLAVTNMQIDDNNQLYCIVSSGTADIMTSGGTLT